MKVKVQYSKGYFCNALFASSNCDDSQTDQTHLWCQTHQGFQSTDSLLGTIRSSSTQMLQHLCTCHNFQCFLQKFPCMKKVLCNGLCWNIIAFIHKWFIVWWQLTALCHHLVSRQHNKVWKKGECSVCQLYLCHDSINDYL